MKATSLLLLIVVSTSILSATTSEKWEALVSHLVANPSSKTPEGIEEIMDELDVSGTEINLKGFEEANIAELRKRIPQDYLIHALGRDLIVSDSFSYFIIKEKCSDSFWVIKTGGFGGVFEIYREREGDQSEQ